MRSAAGFPLILLATGWIASPAEAQLPPFVCDAAVSVPPIVRAEGLTEPVGDVILVCAGGEPTAPGQPVPQANFTIFLNTNLTSKVTAGLPTPNPLNAAPAQVPRFQPGTTELPLFLKTK